MKKRRINYQKIKIMLINSTITVKFSAGTSIEYAFTEAIRISRILWVNVEFQFNEVTCFATPHGDPQVGADQYHKAGESKSSYKFASSSSKFNP